MAKQTHKTITDIYFARRCKSLIGTDVYNTIHAVQGDYTLCGSRLSEMWWLYTAATYKIDDVTCKKCRKAIREMRIK